MLFRTMAFELIYPLCFLLLLLLLQLPFPTISQTYQNVSLGSSLIAWDDNSFWPSPSGEFAFGFQKIGSDGFLLAIWFNKIPERTIVWSANGNNLVQKGSRVELTADGQLLLNDIATGKDISIASSAGTGVTYAAMLDTGNFVLANQNSINSWESFSRPTDTILPTQTLNQSSNLFARYMPTNYSKGRFLLTLQSDGNLVLYTTYFPFESSNSPYWSTLTGSGFQVIFNQSGFLYLTDKSGSILNMISPSTVSMQDYYQRATLEYDGVLRHYVYPKTTSSSVKRAWSALSLTPQNICTSILERTGGGACGFNSLCRNDDQGPHCQCPNGYTLTDPNDGLKGCKQDFVSQSCAEASLETDLFYLQEMQSTDWTNSANYEYFYPVNEEWCRQSCLGDCFCDIAFFNNQNCWKKSIPLSNGRIDSSVEWKALIKIRKANSTSMSGGADSIKKHHSDLILHGFVLLIISFLFVFLLLAVTYLVASRIYFNRKEKVSQLYPVIQNINLKCFTYTELKEATNDFKEELGSGSFGTVFKGVLASDNGKCVAVKRLDAKVKESDLEFTAEVSAIGRTNHRNLVQLIGFCNEGQHRILVYEFMSNGSLASFLFGESRPNWYLRREIALGTARGLLYLHEECSSQIIHCDIKPQNILLDDSLTARIADFGVAKLLKTDQTQTTTAIRGTKGYVAPEWFKSLPVTVKVDVYSYGILLLEIICCRKNFEVERKDENEMILADWAYDCYNQKKLHLLLEIDDEEIDDIKEMEKYVKTALWCIQDNPTLRPTMKDVTQMLEGTLDVSIPPDPSSF